MPNIHLFTAVQRKKRFALHPSYLTRENDDTLGFTNFQEYEHNGECHLSLKYPLPATFIGFPK